MNPGQFLVDIIPIRKPLRSSLVESPTNHSEVKYVPEWFPGAGFQKQAKIWRASVDRMLHVPFNLAKQLLVGSQAFPPSTFSRCARYRVGCQMTAQPRTCSLTPCRMLPTQPTWRLSSALRWAPCTPVSHSSSSPLQPTELCTTSWHGYGQSTSSCANCV